ncbi:hypothetical protein [Staphylococcus haemolyticus]|uniref:hypothetical protein n=1 Tax=Staphylococcus haemolyticus TaxID=1283 RepID=UPI00374F3799
MSNTDKSILISGMMFNTMFFLLMLSELVITKAAGYALFAAIVTYIFFEYVYYAEKKTETHGHE